MAAISGKDGKFDIGGTEFCTVSWSCDVSVDEVDTTSSCDDGQETVAAGISKCRGSAVMTYDPATGIVANLIPGTTVSSMKLYYNATTYIDIPSALITSLGTALEVKGGIQVTVNFVGLSVNVGSVFDNA